VSASSPCTGIAFLGWLTLFCCDFMAQKTSTAHCEYWYSFFSLHTASSPGLTYLPPFHQLFVSANPAQLHLESFPLSDLIPLEFCKTCFDTRASCIRSALWVDIYCAKWIYSTTFFYHMLHLACDNHFSLYVWLVCSLMIAACGHTLLQIVRVQLPIVPIPSPPKLNFQLLTSLCLA
jgi:hypothetical protein